MKKAKNGKRKSPNSIPATKADVAKAKKEASSEAVTRAWAIMFSVLHDKRRATNRQTCSGSGTRSRTSATASTAGTSPWPTYRTPCGWRQGPGW